jgi:polar amino acid transport system ATP-binding protein
VKRERLASPAEDEGGGPGGETAQALTGSTPATAGPLIEVVGLGKDFGATRVLEDVDFRVDSGEKVCIVGPSGSGKTTLLRCLNLLVEPSRGKLHHRGELVGDWPDRPPTIDLRDYRSRIGMVFQHFELFPHLTALHNIALAPRHILGESRADAHAKARRLLEQIGLAHLADAHPHRLSGGQKQRVAIARALAMDPELILFDEPTSALDPEMVEEVLAMMAALAVGGTTMVIVTHELGFAHGIADRLVVMESGRVVEQGPAADLFERPSDPRTRRILRPPKTSWRQSDLGDSGTA